MLLVDKVFLAFKLETICKLSVFIKWQGTILFTLALLQIVYYMIFILPRLTRVVIFFVSSNFQALHVFPRTVKFKEAMKMDCALCYDVVHGTEFRSCSNRASKESYLQCSFIPWTFWFRLHSFYSVSSFYWPRKVRVLRQLKAIFLVELWEHYRRGKKRRKTAYPESS